MGTVTLKPSTLRYSSCELRMWHIARGLKINNPKFVGNSANQMLGIATEATLRFGINHGIEKVTTEEVERIVKDVIGRSTVHWTKGLPNPIVLASKAYMTVHQIAETSPEMFSAKLINTTNQLSTEIRGMEIRGIPDFILECEDGKRVLAELKIASNWRDDWLPDASPLQLALYCYMLDAVRIDEAWLILGTDQHAEIYKYEPELLYPAIDSIAAMLCKETPPDKIYPSHICYTCTLDSCPAFLKKEVNNE